MQSLAARLSHLFPHTVSIQHPNGVLDDYGDPTYEAAVSYKAQVRGSSRKIIDFNGDEQISTRTIIVAGLTGAKSTSRVILADGSSPKLLAVKTMPDASGDLFDTLYT